MSAILPKWSMLRISLTILDLSAVRSSAAGSMSTDAGTWNTRINNSVVGATTALFRYFPVCAYFNAKRVARSLFR
jgi:hypothetical protein